MAKEGLTPKQEAFCQAFANADSDTYHKKADSARAAGYSEGSAANTATTLCNKNPLSIARIQEIYDINAPKHKSRILSHLEYGRREAAKDRKWGDYMTSCKLQAQICGFLFESSTTIEMPEIREYTEAELKIIKEAGRKLTLLDMGRKDGISDSPEPFSDSDIING